MKMIFSIEEKKEILTFIRAIIGAHFEDTTIKKLSDMDGKIAEQGSCFVTLHRKDGSLRGCIGNIAAYESLGKNIEHNTINSAFGDPRFPQLIEEELVDLEIEISILTSAQPIASANDFIIGEHGIILECRGRSAVFLPQVAPEQNWTREDTLTNLCYKANLPFRAWDSEDAKLSVFTAIVFSEKDFQKK
jgi:AmmeMemoRadiSam system protein A